MRAHRIAVLGLALVALAAGSCRRSDPAPPPEPAIAARPAPAPGAWRLEPDDLLAQPLEPSLQPWTLAIVSGDGVDARSLRDGFSVPESQDGRPFVWATG
jgi:hypothetical protein